MSTSHNRSWYGRWLNSQDLKTPFKCLIVNGQVSLDHQCNYEIVMEEFEHFKADVARWEEILSTIRHHIELIEKQAAVFMSIAGCILVRALMVREVDNSTYQSMNAICGEIEKIKATAILAGYHRVFGTTSKSLTAEDDVEIDVSMEIEDEDDEVFYRFETCEISLPTKIYFKIESEVGNISDTLAVWTDTPEFISFTQFIAIHPDHILNTQYPGQRLVAVSPFSGEKVPVFPSSEMEFQYGFQAILGVPSVKEEHRPLAEENNIRWEHDLDHEVGLDHEVDLDHEQLEHDILKEEEDNCLINSGQLGVQDNTIPTEAVVQDRMDSVWRSNINYDILELKETNEELAEKVLVSGCQIGAQLEDVLDNDIDNAKTMSFGLEGHVRSVHKAVIPSAGLRELVDEDGVNELITFRCSECSKCVKCKTSNQHNTISLQEKRGPDIVNSDDIPLFHIEGTINIADRLTKKHEVSVLDASVGSDWQNGLSWMKLDVQDRPLKTYESLTISPFEEEMLEKECFDEAFSHKTSAIDGSVCHATSLLIPAHDSVFLISPGRETQDLVVDPVYYGWLRILRIIIVIFYWRNFIGFPGKPHKNARIGVKLYALVTVCIAIGATSIMVLEGLETQDVVQAVERHGHCHGMLAHLYVDSGTQLKALEAASFSLPGFNMIVYKRQKLIGHVSTPKSHEERGRVERKIEIIRSTLEKMGILATSPLAATQWETIFAHVANTLDDLPLAKGNSSSSSFTGFEVLTAYRIKLDRDNSRSLEGPGITMEMSQDLRKILDRNRETYFYWYQFFIQNIHLLTLKSDKWLFDSRKPIVGDSGLFTFNDADLWFIFLQDLIYVIGYDTQTLVRMAREKTMLSRALRSRPCDDLLMPPAVVSNWGEKKLLREANLVSELCGFKKYMMDWRDVGCVQKYLKNVLRSGWNHVELCSLHGFLPVVAPLVLVVLEDDVQGTEEGVELLLSPAQDEIEEFSNVQ